MEPNPNPQRTVVRLGWVCSLTVALTASPAKADTKDGLTRLSFDHGIGDTIEAVECRQYGILTDVDGLVWTAFYRRDDGQIFQEIATVGGDGREHRELHGVSPTGLVLLENDLNRRHDPESARVRVRQGRRYKEPASQCGKIELTVATGYFWLGTKVAGRPNQGGPTWSGSVEYYLSRSHQVGLRYTHATFDRRTFKSCAVSLTHQFGNRWVAPYVGAGVGVQSAGAVVHRAKPMLVWALGIRTRVIVSWFVELRPLGVLDSDVDDRSSLTSWGQISTGLGLRLGRTRKETSR